LLVDDDRQNETGRSLIYFRSIVVDESSDTKSNLSLSTSDESEESNSNLKRRSVRRVSSSSMNTSSKTITTKEPLYTRRRVNQSDTLFQRMTRSTQNPLNTSE
jgi:hypothetical protein